MIIDDITELIIQRTLDEGGKVYALNQTDKFEVLSASGNQITIDSSTYQFAIGDKISIIYEPKYSSAWCEGYSDLDGDGIIDLVDLDKDGDGVLDPRAPLRPSHVISQIITIPNDVTILGIEKSPNRVLVKAREWGKPLVIDGYYPLYITQAEALWASPMTEPLAHPHMMSEEFDGITYQWEYWMPHGVNQWHGNYHNCPPEPISNLQVTSVETYDFEYVDRIAGRGVFASIIPYDYVDRILGVDKDENGTYESTENYSLQSRINIEDSFDETGELLTAGDFAYTHYITEPRQAWTFEVIAKDTSENVLADGHSFQLGNYAYYVRTYSKFDPNTEDARKHTLSNLAYHSKLTNGSRAEFSAEAGAIVIYNDGDSTNDTWRRVVPLEVNDQGFIILDNDIFDVGSRFYISEEYVPFAPSNVDAFSETKPQEVSGVKAEEVFLLPKTPYNVNAITPQPPFPPTIISAGFIVGDQEIIWGQFADGSTTGDQPLQEVIDEEVRISRIPVNPITDAPYYDLKYDFWTQRFIRINPFERLITASNTSDTGYEHWDAYNNLTARSTQSIHAWHYNTKQMFLSQTTIPNILLDAVDRINTNSGDKSSLAPVNGISGNDAVKFIRKLNNEQRTRGNLPDGWFYALPTSPIVNKYLGADALDFSSQEKRFVAKGDSAFTPARPSINYTLELTPEHTPVDMRDDLQNAYRYMNVGDSYKKVTEGYTNRYGFIAPIGNVKNILHPTAHLTTHKRDYDHYIALEAGTKPWGSLSGRNIENQLLGQNGKDWLEWAQRYSKPTGYYIWAADKRGTQFFDSTHNDVNYSDPLALENGRFDSFITKEVNAFPHWGVAKRNHIYYYAGAYLRPGDVEGEQHFLFNSPWQGDIHYTYPNGSTFVKRGDKSYAIYFTLENWRTNQSHRHGYYDAHSIRYDYGGLYPSRTSFRFFPNGIISNRWIGNKYTTCISGDTGTLCTIRQPHTEEQPLWEVGENNEWKHPWDWHGTMSDRYEEGVGMRLLLINNKSGYLYEKHGIVHDDLYHYYNQ